MAKPTKPNRTLKDMGERLFHAHMALRSVLPEATHDLLTSDHACLTRADVWKWHDEMIESVLKMAQIIPKPGSERAYCPLCGGSTTAPYTQGFDFPNGLTVHLRGERSAHECA